MVEGPPDRKRPVRGSDPGGSALRLGALVVVAALVLAVVGIGFGAGAAAAAGGGTNHTSCTTISDEGLHVLTSDVTNSSARQCIEITASNVTLDGNGYTVDGVDESAPSQGVLVGTDVTNVTVRNVTLTGWENGVEVQNANGTAVRNATLVGNRAAGVRAVGSANVTVVNTNASNNKWGVYFDRSPDTTISDVSATENSHYGMELVKSPNATASRVDASGGGSQGIYLVDSTNSSVTGTTVSANGETGIEFYRSGNATLRNVTATGNDGVGLMFYHSANGTIRNVTVSGGGDFGIYFTSQATDNVVTNSTVVDNDGPAVFIDSWSGDVPTNRFENLTIGDSTAPNTTLSFTGRAVVIDQVVSPPDDPPGRLDASRYLDVTGIVESSYLNLTLDYDDGDVPDESTLALFRNTSTGWNELAGSSVDTSANELSVNFTSVPVSSSYPVTNWSVVGAFANDPSLTDCSVIDSEGAYTLESDVTHTGGSNCIEITASDVVLDGNGHVIEWTGSDPRNDAGNAVHVTGTNVTVRNVTARHFNAGVAFDGASNGTIVGVNATANGYAGIHLSGSSGVEVENNAATDNYYPGIWVESSSNNTFSGNSVSGNYAGFWLASGSTGNQLTDDDASGNDIAVFAVGGSSNNAMTDIDASNSTVYSYYSDGGTTNAVTSMNVGNSTAANTSLSFVARDVGVAASASPSEIPVGLVSIDRYFYAKNVSAGAFLDVTMPYDEDDLALPESSLALYDGSDGSWTEVAGASVDTAANTISANLTPNATFGAFAHSPGAVTGCQDVDAGGAYEFLTDVSSSDASTCVEITASNVTLDGMGHTIDGGPGGDGVHANGSISNVTVRNLTVANGDTGVHVGAGTDATLATVTVTNASDVGVNVTGGASLTVDDSTVTDSGSHGVLVESGTLSVHDSTVNASGGRGIYVEDGNAVTIEGSAVNDSDGNGLRVDVQVDEVRVENTVFDGNGRATGATGVRIDGASVTLLDNTVRDSGSNGFWVDYGGDSPATFEGNRALNNSNHGFRVGLYSTNATFDGDAVADNDGDGFLVQGEATGTDVALNGTTVTAFEAGGVALSPTRSTPPTPANATALGPFVNATEVDITTPSSLDITLPYDEPSGPHLVVSLWRYDGNWTELDGSIDDAADAVTVTNVSSFSTFAPLSTRPAQFFAPTIDAADDTVERGENVTVATSVENLGHEGATQTVTLVVNGSVVDSQALTLSGGASGPVTLEWATESVTPGNYTAVVGTANATASRTVEVVAANDGPSSDDGSPAPGGGSSDASRTRSAALTTRTDTGVTVAVVNGQPGVPVRTTLPNASAGGVSYDDLSISFSDSAGDFDLAFTPLDSKPEDVPEPAVEASVAYFQVEGGPGDETVDSATISFTLDDGALPPGADPAAVTVLRRHDGEWQRLETERVGDGYRATIPGFSTFAVVVDRAETTSDGTAETRTETPTTGATAATATTEGTTATTATTATGEATTRAGTTATTGDDQPARFVLLVLLVVVVAAAALVVARRR